MSPSASTTVAPAASSDAPDLGDDAVVERGGRRARPSAGVAPRDQEAARLIMRHPRSPRQQQVERGHSHRDSVRDLLEHRGPRRIGGSGGDLQPAVHRARGA